MSLSYLISMAILFIVMADEPYCQLLARQECVQATTGVDCARPRLHEELTSDVVAVFLPLFSDDLVSWGPGKAVGHLT